MQVTTGERGAGRRGKIRGEKSRKTSRECRRVLRCEWLSAAKQRVGVGRGGKKERKEISPAARLRRLPEDNGPRRSYCASYYFFSLFKTHPIV